MKLGITDIIIHCGLYYELVNYLDIDDVYELASLNEMWRFFMGHSFQRYWENASVNTFGLRYDLLKVIYRYNYSWFSYYEYLINSDLRIFLANQKKVNTMLFCILSNLKFDRNNANTLFSLQNKSETENDQSLVMPNRSQHYGVVEKDMNNYVTMESGIEIKNYVKNIELDLGGLGKGYLWEMRILSITSQKIVLTSERKLEDIPCWNIGRMLIEYIAVWGIASETEYILLYHHKNPFHSKSGVDKDSLENDNNPSNAVFNECSHPRSSSQCLSLSLYGSQTSLYSLPTYSSISRNLGGINYFLSNMSSFAGLDMKIDEAKKNIKITITLQADRVLKNIVQNMLSKRPMSHEDGNTKEEVDYAQELLYGEDFKSTQDTVNDESDSDKDEAEKGLVMYSSLEVKNIIFPRHLPSEKIELFSPTCLNIELELKDNVDSIPMYMYGEVLEHDNNAFSLVRDDIKAIANNFNCDKRDFKNIRFSFRSNSSLIKTNCLYDIGISIIDKLTGEIVLNASFPKSKSYYERRNQKYRRLLKLCSFSRIYGTHVPMVDPPYYLTNKPESVLSKLELLIDKDKNTFGRISEVNVSLNMHECKTILPSKKFKRIFGYNCHNSSTSNSVYWQGSNHNYRRRSINPIKKIRK